MMDGILNVVKYGAVFLGLYVQVFLLLTYIGWGSKEDGDSDDAEKKYTDADFPTVGIIVPAFNEEVGVVRTVESLLHSEYPTDKLHIIVVDDGSKDRTWEIVQQYKNNPRVSLYTKPNGGKFTALNFGLERTTADIVGCLDADSTIAPDAIYQSMLYFLKDAETYAVVPTMTVDNPKTFIQLIQKVEFEGALYMREVFGRLGSLFVAPGPLTLFRKEVFEKLGPYRHGHLGEDLEIAVRMQYNHMKIVYGNKSRVYTFGMKTLKTLLKQRVRWTNSFLMNLKDYKMMVFNPAYGHLGLLVFPVAVIGLLFAVILTPIALYNVIVMGIQYITPFFYGVHPTATIDTFYMNTQSLPLLGIMAISFALGAILIGRSLNKQKLFSFDLLTLAVYPFVSAIWTFMTLWKLMRSETITWR